MSRTLDPDSLPPSPNSVIKTIFLEISEKAPQERGRELDARCAGDASIRAAVEELLWAHDQAGRFMAGPTVEPRPGAGATMEPRHIGPYKILQSIGEGGFGTVYMAEQESPVRRRVALKLIKAGMDTREVIARFEAERQALAILDHPNIARVLDAGATDAARPYFVMELVKGVPITEYCDKGNLDITQRLELFAQVCQAVQHAHQKGIIHRDIKPSNVLVNTQDDKPLAKIIDFGIAKATQSRLTEKTLFTEFRQLIGTPEYMSP
ncbi:MAG: serine/threonine protein kinase, partial [Tepidisphaeraceae bacterium]